MATNQKERQDHVKWWLKSFLSRGYVYKASRTFSATKLSFRLFKKPKRIKGVKIDIDDILQELIPCIDRYTRVSIIGFKKIETFDDFDVDPEEDKGGEVLLISFDLKQVNM